jgi:hypothetical protein
VLERISTLPSKWRVLEKTLVAQCKSCGEDVEELVTVNVGGKKRRLCESCADEANEQEAVKEESEAVVQKMMDFKGRR